MAQSISAQVDGRDSVQGSFDTLKVFSPEELARYDGRNGHPAYVAVDGVVYDFSDLSEWKSGSHESHPAGRDLSEEILMSPHGKDALDGKRIVGRMALNPERKVSLPNPAELARETGGGFSPDLLGLQARSVKVHKALAFTTAGLLLAADVVGTAHLIDLIERGHAYRDSIGFGETDDETIRTNKIKRIWESGNSQSSRVIHGALIAATSVAYTATATIELVTPRMSRNPSPHSNSAIHRKLFYLHAALMAANIGLGFAESYALSQGNHDAAIGLGMTHAVIGIAAPVVLVGSGLSFRLPWK